MLRAARAPSWRRGEAEKEEARGDVAETPPPPPPPLPSARDVAFAAVGVPSPAGSAAAPPATPPRAAEERRRGRRGAEPISAETPPAAAPSPRAHGHRRTARELLRETACGAEPGSPRGALLLSSVAAAAALGGRALLSGLAHLSASSSADAAANAAAAADVQTPTATPPASPRSASSLQPAPSRAADVAQLSVLSLCVGGVAGRWRERLPALRKCIAELQARTHARTHACAPALSHSRVNCACVRACARSRT
jgi:hypothetical protein